VVWQLARDKHAVIVRPQKISRKKTARMDTKVDTKLEICGHQDGHQAAKLLRRKELVPKKGIIASSADNRINKGWNG